MFFLLIIKTKSLLFLGSRHRYSDKSTVNYSNKRPPIVPHKSSLIKLVVLKIGLLQWQDVLWNIYAWFYKPDRLFYGRCYTCTHIERKQHLLYYYNDNFNTGMFEKRVYISYCLYHMSENVN